MKTKYKTTSRTKTPWDNKEELSPTETLIRDVYVAHFYEKHKLIKDTKEADLLNSYEPDCCPYCGSIAYKKDGKNRNKVQRFRCSLCNKTFQLTTNTIFDSHKIPIQECIEYLLCLIHSMSTNASSRTNKNSITTAQYWLNKYFLVLEGLYDSIVLSGVIYCDETYIQVNPKDRVLKENGNRPRGLSQNKICIAVITDGKYTYCCECGRGKPSKRKLTKLKNHIQPGSTLIHDGENAHSTLIEELHLTSIVHTTDETKGLADKENPLNPINSIHRNLKYFLNSHSGFNKDNLNSYLNLFMFITNPPENDLEKVDLFMKLALKRSILLRYRSKIPHK